MMMNPYVRNKNRQSEIVDSRSPCREVLTDCWGSQRLLVSLYTRLKPTDEIAERITNLWVSPERPSIACFGFGVAALILKLTLCFVGKKRNHRRQLHERMPLRLKEDYETDAFFYQLARNWLLNLHDQS